MGYIQSREHFTHFISKAARNNGLNPDQMYPLEFYIENIYEAGIGDHFTWKVKESAEWLYRSKTREFLEKVILSEFSWPHKWDQCYLSNQFTDLLKDAYNRPGVYIFETVEGQALYVGRSISNLQSRVAQSFMGRFNNYNEQVYLKMILCNASDASLLEVYFITTLKPILNHDCRYRDGLTIAITSIPPFTQRVPCFEKEAADE